MKGVKFTEPTSFGYTRKKVRLGIVGYASLLHFAPDLRER
jgi:hypothetical protein